LLLLLPLLFLVVIPEGNPRLSLSVLIPFSLRSPQASR
jgi:hypothetical protein